VLNDEDETAFPVHPDQMNIEFFGMSLRDYFAGQVIAGLYPCHDTVEAREECAAVAYQMADAMVEARKKYG